jgi:hypothetical protein
VSKISLRGLIPALESIPQLVKYGRLNLRSILAKVHVSRLKSLSNPHGQPAWQWAYKSSEIWPNRFFLDSLI